MEQKTTYRQLQPEDRMTIASMMQQGSSMRAMSRVLGRDPATISRELARNTLANQRYASHSAQLASHVRRRTARPAAKLDLRGLNWSVVLTLLDWRWAPQQIAGTLKRVFPNEPEDLGVGAARDVDRVGHQRGVPAHQRDAGRVHRRDGAGLFFGRRGGGCAPRAIRG